jgi:DNA-binding MarR family transcriptional regulator
MAQVMRMTAVPAWLRLARVFQKVDRASVEHLRQWDLSVAQFDVLAQVGSAEGQTQQEVADRLLVTKGNICQLLDRLERNGLIVRRQEGRANRLFLTPKGRQLYERVVPAQEALIAESLSPLTADEQRQLLALLRKLDHALP